MRQVCMRASARTLGRTCALAATLCALAATRPATADYLAYSGTTAGGPTWNRPIGNGNLPPDSLSGTGTNVAYHAHSFTVTTSGLYDFTSVGVSPVDWDNYTFLYQGTFDAANPLTNVVIGNDDNPFIGQSGFQSVALTSGQSYVLVTTGFANTDEGSFENSIAQQFVFQTGSTTGGPTWDPFQVGEAIPYTVLEFTVSTTGLYSFQSTAGFDNFTVLYQDAFDPNDPNANLLNFNDDNPDIGLSGFLGQPLVAGVRYFFVTTGFDESSFGEFSNAYSGPGRLLLVPEPAGIASMAIGLAGVVGWRHRTRARRTS